MSFHVGQTFGEYSITAVLSAGSMGRLYKVEHQLTKRTEAMKVLGTEIASEKQLKRFEREMLILARLSHPNIATLHNALYADNQLILMMELVEGRTLESLFSGGRIPHEKGLSYIRQILFALQYAHLQGVVHRDVTPSNVMVTAKGEIKLTDFGVSKSYGDSLLTNCGEILGALPYMAPEQLKGTSQPDSRSDIYSVGAILYEHLTGQKPFGAARRLSAVLDDSEAEPLPPTKVEPSLPPRWDTIIRYALAREPDHRYQSAEQFLDALAHLDEEPREEFVLPPMHALSFGGAILAVLIFVLVASPAINKFRAGAPASLPSRLLHIPPPAFATLTTVYDTETGPGTTVTSVAKFPPRRISKRAEEAAEARLEDPSASSAIRPSAGQTSEPVASERPAGNAVPPTAEKKSSIWGKLNIFKRKGLEQREKQ